MEKITFNQAIEYLEAEGLESKELTYSLSGYPKFGGHRRIAFYGFDSIDDALKCATNANGTIEKIYWKDGHTLAYSYGEVYSELEITPDLYGDDYYEWIPENEWDDLSNLIESEYSYMRNAEQLNNLIDYLLKFKENLIESEDLDRNHFILCKNGRYYDTLERYPMHWRHDTRNYEIAVVIKNTDYDEEI